MTFVSSPVTNAVGWHGKKAQAHDKHMLVTTIVIKKFINSTFWNIAIKMLNGNTNMQFNFEKVHELN